MPARYGLPDRIMDPVRIRRPISPANSKYAIAAVVVLIVCFVTIIWKLMPKDGGRGGLLYVSTIAGINGEMGEPFGIAEKNGDIYISDGQNGKVWICRGDKLTPFAEGLDTPSGIAFNKGGGLIVADSGDHTIRSINSKGESTIIAGVAGRSGYADGDAAAALFNAPIGVVADPDGKIFITDTYNDKIRLIDNGKVTTLAGSDAGYSDGPGLSAKFNTPTGISFWQDKIIVADTANRRIRVIEPDARVWTLAGTGEGDLVNGPLSHASFVQPTAIASDGPGIIYIADGNSIRRIGGNTFPYVTSVTSVQRGILDGPALAARFNRPSGLLVGRDGSVVVADSENRLIRQITPVQNGHEITKGEIDGLRERPEAFRSAQGARWPFDPPQAKRDIAGTLGEVRGEVKDGNDEIWFHNGLDISGGYGETARFIRDEKVLRPESAENFDTLRELIRMPTLGYIHIRIGRDQTSKPFGDPRFQFIYDTARKMTGVRVPRGTKFKAGDAIGTLNSMNHVHLIAGRSGSEMNALDALSLPGIADSRPPVIERVSIYDQNWNLVETERANSRIKLSDKLRIVVRAYDQVNGNPEKRRLGVYKIGYQILNADRSPVFEPKWTIIFDRMPSNKAVPFAYANGSRSGATGETIFNYIASNRVEGDEYREGFLDAAELGAGSYTLRIFVGDYFGNLSSKDVEIEVIK